MHITPRPLLCATVYQGASNPQEGRGRSRSCGSCPARPEAKFHLAISMARLVTQLLYARRTREGSAAGVKVRGSRCSSGVGGRALSRRWSS